VKLITDILSDLYHKKISTAQAQQLLINIISLKKGRLTSYEYLLQMSISEWCAIAYQGMPIATIARWRYEGWPTHCAICNQMCSINIHSRPCRPMHTLRFDNTIKKDVLVHLDCLQELPREKSKPRLYTKKYAHSPFWPTIEKALKHLEITTNLKIINYYDDVIGVIVQRLEKARQRRQNLVNK
jgi:hypothetical protein